MKEKIMVNLLSFLVPALLKMLTPEMLKKWTLAGLDSLEREIKDSENKIDDAALPLIDTIREVVK